MSDYQTMKEHLLRDIHIDTAPSGSEGGDDVTKAIIESIKYNRRYKFGFNTAKHKFYTDANVRGYKLPLDFMSLVSDPYIQSAEDSYNKRRLVYRPMDWVEENEHRGTEFETSINSGTPIAFSIDTSVKQMELIPIPSSSGDVVTFTYHLDPGTPVAKYTGSAWVYYAPNTQDTLAATYTNAWFVEGYELIYNRAAYILWSRVMGGTEEAGMRGAEHIKQWAEELNRLRAEDNKYQSVSELRRWI